MESFECKNCGGTIEKLEDGLGKCTSCRCIQSIPKINAGMFNRANTLRLNDMNFDAAGKVYNDIINDNEYEAEAYWGSVICRYGIVYEKEGDEYIPTCQRTIERDIMDDSDFKKAVEYAPDEATKQYYISQAEKINKIQRKILDIANNEKPFDIFISFKQNDDDTGEETRDCKEATKWYYELKDNGYKVFFSPVTLKDHAGEEYEPYIYAALKSAPVMILMASKPEYVNAKWVRNEWRRFLAMKEGGAQKKLIVALRDMDEELLPAVLSKYEALRLDSSTFYKELIDNIDSVVKKSAKKTNIEDMDLTAAISEHNKLAERETFDKAVTSLNNGMFNEDILKVFNGAIAKNATNSKAYWYRMLYGYAKTEAEITNTQIDFGDNSDFIDACKCANEEEMAYYQQKLDTCRKNISLQKQYEEAANRQIDAACTFRDDDEDTRKKKHCDERLREVRSHANYYSDAMMAKFQRIRRRTRNQNITALVFCVIVSIAMVYFMKRLFYGDGLLTIFKLYQKIGVDDLTEAIAELEDIGTSGAYDMLQQEFGFVVPSMAKLVMSSIGASILMVGCVHIMYLIFCYFDIGRGFIKGVGIMILGLSVMEGVMIPYLSLVAVNTQIQTISGDAYIWVMNAVLVFVTYIITKKARKKYEEKRAFNEAHEQAFREFETLKKEYISVIQKLKNNLAAKEEALFTDYKEKRTSDEAELNRVSADKFFELCDSIMSDVNSTKAVVIEK